jgi:hypothetical protein
MSAADRGTRLRRFNRAGSPAIGSPWSIQIVGALLWLSGSR